MKLWLNFQFFGQHRLQHFSILYGELVIGYVYSERLSTESISVEDLSADDLSAEDLSVEDLSAVDLSAEDRSEEDVSVEDTAICRIQFPNMNTDRSLNKPYVNDDTL